MSSGPDQVNSTQNTNLQNNMTSGNQGSSNVNTRGTTSIGPQGYLGPLFQGGANSAYTNYLNNSSGNPLQNLGVNSLAARGQVGSGVTNAAQGQITDTLSGNYLGSNPYLDSVFNSAADQTQTRLASEFAGSGRNLGAAMPARSAELQHLAANIYAPAYESERNRQVGAAGQAVPLANQDYTDINAILGASQIPGQARNDALSTYLSQLGGVAGSAGQTTTTAGNTGQQFGGTGYQYGTTQGNTVNSQDVYNNPLGQIAGGLLGGYGLLNGFGFFKPQAG